MGVNTEKFIRKPLYVDAVRLDADNFDDVVEWCQGEVLTDDIPGQGIAKKYIKVRVHNPKNPRQTKAFMGDWLLYTERGYKVYTNKAFRASFDPVGGQELPAAPAVLDSVSVVPEDPDPGQGVGEISTELVRAPVVTIDEGVMVGDVVPEKEEIELVEATPQAIADVVNEQQPVEPLKVADSDTAPPQQTPDGRRVLSEREQREMTAEEVQELLRSGQAILVQDLA